MNLWFIGLVISMISYGGVWAVRWWTTNHLILAIPNKRSSHATPTPTGGGLAIAILTTAIWAGLALYFNAESWVVWIPPLLGVCMIIVVGWLDDLHPLSSNLRFSVQGVATILVILGFGVWEQITLPIIGDFWLGRLGYLITFLWMVGLTNAYNFMDGIDGLAGGQAVIAGFGWMVVGYLFNVSEVTLLGLLVATSSLGFLGHNWSPAHIFMGDVGSGFLGFIFAILPLILVNAGVSGAFVIAIFFMWPFLFDTSYTFFKRVRNKENVFQAHRSHLYQRLVILGFSHAQTATIYLVYALMGVVAGIISINSPNWITLLIFILLVVLGVSLIFFVEYKEHHPLEIRTAHGEILDKIHTK